MQHIRADILLVEPDEDLAEMFSQHLETGLVAQVRAVDTAAAAFREFLADPADVIITEARLPDASGFDLIHDLHAVCDGPVVMTTSEATLRQAVEALRLGVFDLLIKPFDLAYLTQVVRWAADTLRLQQREQARTQRFRLLARRLMRQRQTLRERLDWASRQTVRAYQHLTATSGRDALQS
jgi:DNA-binding NtrC family response regulator